LYRFVPREKSKPFIGKLQAMRHANVDRFDLSTQMPTSGTIPVEWVDIPDPDPKSDTVRYQARDLGAARLVRGEGIWFDEGTAYVCSTTGGPAGRGQVFALKIGSNGKRDALRQLVASPAQSALDMPDNITVAPWGDIILAEDGGGEQFIRGLTKTGELYDIARNAKSSGEFAGVCFSPDGSTLFVNMQMDGVTIAICGRSLPNLASRA
jgi:secreted PhoX family phosphatase